MTEIVVCQELWLWEGATDESVVTYSPLALYGDRVYAPWPGPLAESSSFETWRGFTVAIAYLGKGACATIYPWC